MADQLCAIRITLVEFAACQERNSHSPQIHRTHVAVLCIGNLLLRKRPPYHREGDRRDDTAQWQHIDYSPGRYSRQRWTTRKQRIVEPGYTCQIGITSFRK